MKKAMLILIMLLLFILPACSFKEPNAYVVKKEALLIDSKGHAAGKAFSGFAVSIQNVDNGYAYFTLSFMDKEGKTVEKTEKFAIDINYMSRQYVEPQPVVMMISTDMIKIKPGSALTNSKGKKIIQFNAEIGPLYYIQLTDMGYMLTMDMNVVYVDKDDVTLIDLLLKE